MSSKLPLSTLYRREYTYVVDDDTISPPTILFKALSKRDINFIRSLSDKDSFLITTTFLERSITQLINFIDTEGNQFTDISSLYKYLSKYDISNLISKISEVSFVTPEILESLSINVAIGMDEKFQTDTWDCNECQRRHLDRQRNCKLRDDYDTIYNPAFKILVNDIEYRDCPMLYRDTDLLRDAFDCYTYYNKGILPDTGALLDQTEFYQFAVSAVHSKEQQLKEEAYNKQ